jgi:hypothetical protein
VSGITAVPDPLAELVLTFYQGRLARIVAIYDRERTQGLTDADLHELVSRVYGVATLQSTPTQLPDPTLRRRTVGQWEDADHLVLLWREAYPARVGLTITSIAEDRVLQEAIAQSERVAAEEAPRRAEEGRAAAAAAIRERDEKQRLGNKAQFKP